MADIIHILLALAITITNISMHRLLKRMDRIQIDYMKRLLSKNEKESR